MDDRWFRLGDRGRYHAQVHFSETQMKTPTFWKLSQGGDAFTHSDMLDSIDSRLVYVHGNTGSMGGSDVSQGENFRTASIGDYFYLTYKNRGIYLLGQFSGPANVFSKRGNGWLDRPFRYIRPAAEIRKYTGDAKWWTPNHNSTFTIEAASHAERLE